METKSILQILEGRRCTQGLSQAALRALADVSIRKKIPSRQKLWNMGDPGEFVGLIVQGFFEIDRLSPSGSETCMGVFGPCDVIGISAVLKKSHYPASSKPFSKNAEILKMYLRPLIQNKNQPMAHEISEWLREMLLAHEQILRDKVDILTANRVDQKVFELLSQLQRRFGSQKIRGESVISIPTSKTQISRLVEARVETVIRLLSDWKKSKLVSFDQVGIHVHDWDELERRVI